VRGFPAKVYRAYADAWLPSVSKKFGIRRVFGTRHLGGCFFGREVPALLVFKDDEEQPVNVYPHEEHGRIVTIKEFMQALLSAGERGILEGDRDPGKETAE
jgi:hypothetical protein